MPRFNRPRPVTIPHGNPNSGRTSGASRGNHISVPVPTSDSQLQGQPFDTANQSRSSFVNDYLAQEFGNGTNNIKFQAVIDALTQGGDAASALSSLLGAGDNRFPDEIWAQLYQYLLQLVNTQDQRQYDRQLTLDQRNYDWYRLQNERDYNSPNAILSRLMATGMSRDAAFQALSAMSGGGSGATQGSTISNNPAVAPPASGTPGSLDLARDQFITSSILQGVQLVGQLAQQGVSIAQGIEQVRSMQVSNAFSAEQLSSYNSTKEVAQVLQNLRYNGTITEEQFSSLSNATDLEKFIRDNSATNESIKALYESPSYRTMLSTPFGRSSFNQYWSSVRDSRDNGTILDQYIRGEQLRNTLSECNIQKCGKEMALIDAQTDATLHGVVESCYRVAEIDSRTALNQENLQFLQDTHGSRVEYQDAVTDTAKTQAKINNDLFVLNHTGFPMLRECKLAQLEMDVAHWSTITDPKVFKKIKDTWLQNAENEQMAAYLTSIYQNAVGGFAEDHPNLWRLVVGFHAAGIDVDPKKFVQNATRAAASYYGAGSVGSIIKQ